MSENHPISSVVKEVDHDLERRLRHPKTIADMDELMKRGAAGILPPDIQKIYDHTQRRTAYILAHPDILFSEDWEMPEDAELDGPSEKAK